MAHKWMQGPMPTEQEVVAEFQKRDLKVKAALEADRQAKEAEKEKKALSLKREVGEGLLWWWWRWWWWWWW